jgi:hypothetical protein
MKIKSTTFFLVFGMFFVACSKEKSLEAYIVNSWQTTYLKIDYETYQKSDSAHVYEDKFENNPEIVAQSNYKSDGTFTAWFLNKKGEKIAPSNGKWSVKNDSLLVEFFYNNRDMKVNYHLTKTEEGFAAKSMYDWDDDGEFDDILTMQTKKINQ